jgi:hypothetical protein
MRERKGLLFPVTPLYRLCPPEGAGLVPPERGYSGVSSYLMGDEGRTVFEAVAFNWMPQPNTYADQSPGFSPTAFGYQGIGISVSAVR